jgi:hypothetical protein
LSDLIDELDAGRAAVAKAYATQLARFAALIPVVQARRDERAAADADPHHQRASLADREVVADVAAALRISERVVHSRMTRARHAVQVFPAVHAALDAGRIDPAHADVICEVGTVLDAATVGDDVRSRYAAVAVEIAGQETPARTREILTRLVSEMVPEQVEEQVRDAAAAKCVRVFDVSPGVARLTVDGPTIEVHGMYDRLTRQAVAIEALNQHNAGELSNSNGVDGADERTVGVTDLRTRDQIRADILIDQVLAGTPAPLGIDPATSDELARIRATVTVTIPATTLVGATTGGAMLPGHGPVDETTAKILAGEATTWTRVFTDPITGAPVQVDTYKPSAAQRRLLASRDEHCRFPGCRRPASRCDIDHTIAREHDGPTALWNLAHLCEAHHIVKHNSDWRVRQIDGGVLVWTGPTGRTYLDRPPAMSRMPYSRAVAFVDDPPEPRHPLLEPAEYGDDPEF